MSGFRLPAAGWRVDFEDPERSFAAKTNFELARSLLIFNVCAVPPCAECLDPVQGGDAGAGQQLPDDDSGVIFRHFCGGGARTTSCR